MERNYKVLKRQTFVRDDCAIVPMRSEDRYKIMKWRNEQLFHLRQSKPLTKSDQDHYFDHVIPKLFSADEPDQLLFSYLYNDSCIGYGGLVHINWVDKNAEISFILETSIRDNDYEYHFSMFLKFIEEIASQELHFHKIFTYAFDVRPEIYPILLSNGFENEARLKEHTYINGVYYDVLIHAKFI